MRNDQSPLCSGWAGVFLFSVLAVHLAACTSRPEMPTDVPSSSPTAVDETPVGMPPEGSTATAETSVGVVSSEVVYPETGAPTPHPTSFHPGTPDPSEQTAIDRIVPGARPRAAIEKHFNALPIAPDDPSRVRANVVFLDPRIYEQSFPKQLWYVLRFPQWPVSISPPAGLASNNLLIYTPDKPLRTISDSQQLQAYFQTNAHPPGTADGAATILKVWLSLSAELAQDGMFEFSVPIVESSTPSSTGGFAARGRINVVAKSGDLGAMSGQVLVDVNGKVLSATVESTLQSGMRPICQATKLLDPDPIVRKMAERDLLVMGRSAQAYLFMQREQATPALRDRIDHIWRQIVAEGR
jgi:hypothetical protein